MRPCLLTNAEAVPTLSQLSTHATNGFHINALPLYAHPLDTAHAPSSRANENLRGYIVDGSSRFCAHRARMRAKDAGGTTFVPSPSVQQQEWRRTLIAASSSPADAQKPTQSALFAQEWLEPFAQKRTMCRL